MRNASVWRGVLGLDKQTVIEEVEFEEADAGGGDVLVVRVRQKARRDKRGRCGRCGQKAPWYDQGRGQPRRWRALDLGTVKAELEADAPRVNCPTHGPTVVEVPWARHNAGHTYDFDQQVAWLVTACSKTAVTQLLRIAWRTVGSIVARVWADIEAGPLADRFAGLRRIGIDEISYKKGHKYLTIVIDHDTGRLVWAAPGRDKATLGAFFDLLGAKRCALITHVTADQAGWIAGVVDQRCPGAVRAADPFHIIAWATEALDQARRVVWNDVRRPTGGARHTNATRKGNEEGKKVKDARWALWKNPGDLTENQAATLDWIAKAHPKLHRAYLLKEKLRLIFGLPIDQAETELDRWIAWAQRCRIDEFVDLKHRIVRHKQAILTAIRHGLSNGRTEGVNTKIRLLTRLAYGFHSPHALIALAMLHLGGHRPTLPGRPTAQA